jgi:hypothetical protein
LHAGINFWSTLSFSFPPSMESLYFIISSWVNISERSKDDFKFSKKEQCEMGGGNYKNNPHSI